MSSLRSLNRLISEIANSPEVLEAVKSAMPVYEFTLLSSQYKQVVEYIRNDTTNSLNNIFTKSGAYIPGAHVDWKIISNLLDAGIQLEDVKVDSALLAVYTRLAVLTKVISSTTDTAASKLKIKSDLVESLVTNTSAFATLINQAIHYNVDTTVNVSSVAAVYTVKLEAKSNVPESSILSPMARKAEKLGVNFLASSILKQVDTSIADGLAARFLDEAVNEFQGRVTGKTLLTEFNKFKTRSIKYITESFKSSANMFKQAAVELKQTIRGDITTLFEPRRYKTGEEPKGTKSAANIKDILSLLLAEAIRARMKLSTDPSNRHYLRYQTGRFAQNAKIESAAYSKSGQTLNIGYSYLKKPYADLYTSSGMYAGVGDGLFFSARGRDVEYIIKSAIQDIAKKFITERLSINPI